MSAQQRAFFESYIVQHNTIQAYRDAGYVKPDDKRGPDAIKNAAYAVLQGARIKAALAAHTAHVEQQAAIEATMAREWVMAQHKDLYDLHVLEQRWGEARANLEDIGKAQGVYTDVTRIDVGERQALSESQESEARRLAGLLVADTVSGSGSSLVRDPGAPGDEIVDVEVLPENDGAEEDEGHTQGV